MPDSASNDRPNGLPRPMPPVNRGTRPREAQAYLDARTLQAQLLKDCADPDTSPAVRAQCVRAWDVLEERKRVLRGKPLPGSLRPEAKPRARARGKLAPVEPAPEPPATE